MCCLTINWKSSNGERGRGGKRRGVRIEGRGRGTRILLYLYHHRKINPILCCPKEVSQQGESAE